MKALFFFIHIYIKGLLSSDLTRLDAVGVNKEESKLIASNDALDLRRLDSLGVNAAKLSFISFIYFFSLKYVTGFPLRPLLPIRGESQHNN